jgi:drug/metabolite transporter (DMT)-like permease
MSVLTPRTIAVFALIGACICWGMSFPVMKGLAQIQHNIAPEASSWFLSAWGLALRFLIASAIVAWWCRYVMRDISRSEWSQALGLGVFTAGGMLFQMDGLSYTNASTSAFITQGYCIFIPLTVAVMTRRFPAPHVVLSAIMVMAGVAILADLDWKDLHLGRGELETLLASLIFTAQIFWVDRSAYARNHMGRVSAVAFATTGLLLIPVAMATMPSWSHLFLVYASGPALGCLLALTLFSTLAAMLLMFCFQRGVGAVAAGIIYSSEPIFACLFAFVVPAWLSAWSGINYANEGLSNSLIVGGGLVLAANLVVQLKPPEQATLPQ